MLTLRLTRQSCENQAPVFIIQTSMAPAQPFGPLLLLSSSVLPRPSGPAEGGHRMGGRAGGNGACYSPQRECFPCHLLCTQPVQASGSTDVQRPESHNGRRGSPQRTRHIASHSGSRGIRSHRFIRCCVRRSREAEGLRRRRKAGLGQACHARVGVTLGRSHYSDKGRKHRSHRNYTSSRRQKPH